MGKKITPNKARQTLQQVALQDAYSQLLAAQQNTTQTALNQTSALSNQISQAQQAIGQALGSSLTAGNTLIQGGNTGINTIPGSIYNPVYGGGSGGTAYPPPNINYPNQSHFNPLDFMTEEQKEELASMLVKKILKAITDDDKEMLRKLLRGKV